LAAVKTAAWFLLGMVSLVSGAAGCESDEASDGEPSGGTQIEPTSGSRLEVHSWSDGQVRLFDTMFDSELDVPCRFQVAADGEQRCLPTQEPGTDFVTVVFADAACQEAVAYASATCNEVQSYAVDTPRAGRCDEEGPIVYRVGSKVAAPEMVFGWLPDGSCGETLVQGEPQFYELAGVAPSEFVSAEIEVIDRDDELGVEMFVGSDGSRVPSGLHDVARGSLCWPVSMGPSREGFCLGNMAFAASAFSDAACSERVATNYQCERSDVILAFEQNESAECVERVFYEVGEEVPSSSVYIEEGQGTCRKDEAPVSAKHYLLGQPRSDLIEVTPTHEGEGRLVLEQYSHDGTAISPSGMLWDQELGVSCWVREFEGDHYCVPTAQGLSDGLNTFVDADCTRQIIEVTRSVCDGELAPVRYFAHYAASDGCRASALDAFYEAEKLEPATYFVDPGDGTCVETPANPTNDYYVTGAEVSVPDTFIKLTYETDE
jgi:hypothetical protein